MIKIKTEHTLPDGSTKECTFDLKLPETIEKTVLEVVNQRDDNVAMLCGISFGDSITASLVMRQLMQSLSNVSEDDLIKRACSNPNVAQA